MARALNRQKHDARGFDRGKLNVVAHINWSFEFAPTLHAFAGRYVVCTGKHLILTHPRARRFSLGGYCSSVVVNFILFVVFSTAIFFDGISGNSVD